jgi:hypothetical protein
VESLLLHMPFHCLQTQPPRGIRLGFWMGRAQRPNAEALRRDGDATDGDSGLHGQMPRLLPARRSHPPSAALLVFCLLLSVVQRASVAPPPRSVLFGSANNEAGLTPGIHTARVKWWRLARWLARWLASTTAGAVCLLTSQASLARDTGRVFPCVHQRVHAGVYVCVKENHTRYIQGSLCGPRGASAACALAAVGCPSL